MRVMYVYIYLCMKNFLSDVLIRNRFNIRQFVIPILDIANSVACTDSILIPESR